MFAKNITDEIIPGLFLRKNSTEIYRENAFSFF